MKKAWKDWAVEHVKKTQMCPGDQPSFGLPSDMLTEEEFNMSINSQGCHRYKGCHFLGELLVPEPETQLEQVKIKDVHINTDILRDDITEVMGSKRLAVLKQNLHVYVDRIHFKSSGALSVPEPLLSLADYIKKSL